MGINTPLMCGKSPIWGFMLLFSFVVAFPGSVVIFLGKLNKLRKTPFTPFDVFILNIIIMDNIYLLLLQPQLYLHTDLVNCAYAAYVNFLHAFNMCGRPLLVTCVCLECYVAVLHPVMYRARKGLSSRLLITVAIWILTMIFGCYFAFSNLSTSDLTPVLIIIMTLPVIVFCDVSILSALKKTVPTGRNMDPQKRRALYIIKNSCVITVVSYLPPIISWSILQLEQFKGKNFDPCIILLPALCITTVGNAMSAALHMGKIEKLDWLKSWLKFLL